MWPLLQRKMHVTGSALDGIGNTMEFGGVSGKTGKNFFKIVPSAQSARITKPTPAPTNKTHPPVHKWSSKGGGQASSISKWLTSSQSFNSPAGKSSTPFSLSRTSQPSVRNSSSLSPPELSPGPGLSFSSHRKSALPAREKVSSIGSALAKSPFSTSPGVSPPSSPPSSLFPSSPVTQGTRRKRLRKGSSHGTAQRSRSRSPDLHISQSSDSDSEWRATTITKRSKDTRR